MILAYESGDVIEARRLHRQLLPLFTGIFKTQGTILVKAGLPRSACPVDRSDSPLVNATADELATLRVDAAAAGVTLPAAPGATGRDDSAAAALAEVARA